MRDWTIAQLLGGAAVLDQLELDGKTLRGSIDLTSGDCSAFIAKVMLYLAFLGIAIAQVRYASSHHHKRAVFQRSLGELDLEGVLTQADALHKQQAFFGRIRVRGLTCCSSQGQPEDSLPPDCQPAG